MLQRERADFIGLSGFLSNPSIIGVYLRQLNAHSTLKKRALDDMRIVRKQVFMFLFFYLFEKNFRIKNTRKYMYKFSLISLIKFETNKKH